MIKWLYEEGLLTSGVSIPTLSDSYLTFMCKEYKLYTKSIFIGDSNDSACLGQSYFNNVQKPFFMYFVHVSCWEVKKTSLASEKPGSGRCFRGRGLNEDSESEHRVFSGPHSAATAQAIRSVGLKPGVVLHVLHFACRLWGKNFLILMVPPNSWHLFIVTYV